MMYMIILVLVSNFETNKTAEGKSHKHKNPSTLKANKAGVH